jgi:ribose-phosphate pyrophosphokinase
MTMPDASGSHASHETSGPVLFALAETRGFGSRVAQKLGVPLADLEERDFEDGEHKIRPLVNVRDRDVYILHSLHGSPGRSPNDKLCRLLFLVGTLKDAAAARVTVIAPYLCYARKDRQTKARDPITIRYLAQLFEAVGTDRVVTMDVHNLAAYQNAFRCDTEHLEAAGLFAEAIRELAADAPLAVVSPDLGGAKRAEALRERLEGLLARPVSKAFVDKQRSQGQVTGDLFAGEVEGRIAVIVDDMISTGTTVARAADQCRRHGARQVIVAATHGLFADGARALWSQSAIDRVIVTDTVPAAGLDAGLVGDRLAVVDTAPIFAEVIRRCHEGGSVTALVAGAPHAFPRQARETGEVRPERRDAG